MANAYLFQFRYSYEPKLVDIVMNVSIGASGAPTLTSNKNKGIRSITRNSAGNYSILLRDNFSRLVSAQSSSIASSPASPLMSVVSDTSSSLSAPTVQIQFRDITGAATDPGNGEVLLIQMVFSNSSA